MHPLFAIAALLSASPQAGRPAPPPNAVEGSSGVSPRFFQRVLGYSFHCPGQVHLIYYFDASDGFRQVDRSGAGELLALKLPSIGFSEFARWNALFALPAIENVPALRKAERKLGLKGPPTPALMAMLIAAPGELELPHLPDTLDSDTLEHDLDKVATAFNSAVLFGVCEQTHVIGGRPTNDWGSQTPNQP